jgi:hypothetical protein
VDRFAGWLRRLTGASVPTLALHRDRRMADEGDVPARPALPPLHQVVSIEQIHVLGDQFARSRSQAEAMAISRRAILLITTNSGLINGTIREAVVSTQIIKFKNAIDYGIQHSPDYGNERNVDRVVDLSPEFLEKLLHEGFLTDAAFTSTTAIQVDPVVNRPFRNTVLHIKARWGADVSDRSPEPHMQEHLLLSGSRFRILKGHIENQPDDPDVPYSQPVRARLWLEQMEPAAEQTVLDPWRIPRRLRS